MRYKKFRNIWNKFFEYDRIAERKIKKSINLFNSGIFIFQVWAMFLYNKIRKKYNCSIHPQIKVGSNFYISHVQDIIIGQTAEIGKNCKIYPGAKIIARVKEDERRVKQGKRRHALIGDNCVIGADAILVGPVQIGNNVLIGAGAIISKNIPNNCTVVGINRIIY